MLLLGHAAVSARRGPRGTCQETRAALWAPAECGVTARSASDGVDVNGIRVHHRRLQYRKYQCGMFRRETPSRPRIPCVYGLEVGVGGKGERGACLGGLLLRDDLLHPGQNFFIDFCTCRVRGVPIEVMGEVVDSFHAYV